MEVMPQCSAVFTRTSKNGIELSCTNYCLTANAICQLNLIHDKKLVIHHYSNVLRLWDIESH